MKLVNGQDLTQYVKCLFFDLLKIVFNTNLKKIQNQDCYEVHGEQIPNKIYLDSIDIENWGHHNNLSFRTIDLPP